MKKLLFASVSLAALVGSHAAIAADLPPAAPIYRAPVAAPAPYYSWTGLYIGGNAGYDWTRGKSTTTAAVGFPVIAPILESTSGHGFFGGGQIGFNYAFGPSFVAGLEADVQGTSNKTTVISPDGSNQHVGRLDLVGTGRARLGFSANNWLFYGTGGVGWSEGKVTRTQLTGILNLAPAGTVESVNNSRVGWTAGGGIEVGLANNWTVRAEYLHLELGNVTYTFPLAGRTTTSTLNMDVVRGAFNYKFSWVEPISSRY